MIKTPKMFLRCGAYTLVEALVASSVLMIGVGAAASLSMTMAVQEEINHEVSRALSYQDAAIRLYQLGMSPETVADVLPEEPSVSQLAFLANPDASFAGVGDLRHKTVRIQMNAGGVTRTHTVEVYRSTIDGEDIGTDEIRDFSSGALSGGFTAP